eukprot:SAG22_NODE_983_length_6163_cov_8.370053_2_plen_409_part_00
MPTYTHKVAALNAANAWMMRGSAIVAEGRGDSARAAVLRQLADNVSALVRTKLYVAGDENGGYFQAEQPGGNRVPVRHVIDFISIATSLADDLSPMQKRQMSGFVKRELLTETWMRALSLNDSSLLHPSANSDRKDHGPLGAYDGWPGETVQAFAMIGEYKAALDLVRTMAAAYDDGPGGQAHQVFTQNGKTLRPTRKAAADQQWFELAGSVAANRVITGLFGVEPPLELNSAGEAPSFLRDATAPRGFKGTLAGLRLRGKIYTVESGIGGLTIREDGVSMPLKIDEPLYGDGSFPSSGLRLKTDDRLPNTAKSVLLTIMAAALAPAASAIDNGLGQTPPKGWRSWNFFLSTNNQSVMEAQMRAAVDKSRLVEGRPTSLAELGWDLVAMDDGWQKCECNQSMHVCFGL